MPELPEVTRTAITLHKSISGAAILEIKIHSGRYSRHGAPEGYAEISQHLPIYVSSVTSKGKFILVTAANPLNNWYIWNTLGMSGSWKKEKSKHSHIEFVTSKGSFFFEDMRNFGTLKFTNSFKETERKLSTLGPDHLNSVISDNDFKTRLMKKPELNITKALMSQTIISGIGNYIKAEALYKCGISPLRSVQSLSDTDFSNLNRVIKEIVVASYLSGGASIKTYSGIDNKKGKFTFSLDVYGKKKCPAGFDVLRQTTEDGRTTHWVPEIQR
jgi:formamidopyrimidine-DNA glycosylase